MEKIQKKFVIKSLRTRLMIVSMMVYLALLAIMIYAVSNFAGVLWATTWADVPPELVAKIQIGGRRMVAMIFMVVLPFWVLGSFYLSSRFSRPFAKLTQTAKDSERYEDLDLDNNNGVFASTAEIEQVKGMLSSMVATIRANDDKFRSIVANQRELIFRWKPDFTLTFVNQAFCEFFNRSETDFLQSTGDELRELMATQFSELFRLIENDLLVSLQLANEVVNDTFLKMPDGETHWLQWRTMALYDEDGNITECQTIGNVLTDLKRTQMDLEEANRQLAALTQELIKSQEEERIMVARFLHDEVLGELGELARSPDENVDENTVQRMIERLRSSIYMLRSPMLNYGLYMALEDLSDHMKETVSSRDGVEFLFKVSKKLARFDSEVETQIYRIIQEACKNAFEHAGARSIRLGGSIDEGRIDLVVEDDGSGFELKHRGDDTTLKRHYGVIGMEERCNIIGAQLEIDSRIGRGTRMRVTWPLQPRSDPEEEKTVPLHLPEN